MIFLAAPTFQAADPDDILKFRAGYYAGMRIVEQIEREMGIRPIELLDITKNEFEKSAYRLLKQSQVRGRDDTDGCT